MFKISNISVQTLLHCEQHLKLLRNEYKNNELPIDLPTYFSTLQNVFSGDILDEKTDSQVKNLNRFSTNNINQLLFIISLLKLFLIKGSTLSSLHFLHMAESEFGFVIDFKPIKILIEHLKEQISFCNCTQLSDLLKLSDREKSVIKLLSFLETIEKYPSHCKLFSYLNKKDKHETYHLSETLDSKQALETKRNPHIQLILHKEETTDENNYNQELIRKIGNLKQLFIVTKMEDGSPVSMKNIKTITSYYSQYLKITFELSRSIPLNIIFVFPSIGIIKKIFSYQQIYLRNISVYKNIFFETDSLFENNMIVDIFKSRSTKGNVLFVGYHSPIRGSLCGHFITVLCGLPTTDYNNVNKYMTNVLLEWVSKDNVILVDSFIMQDQMRRMLPNQFTSKWNNKNVSLTVQKVVKSFDYNNVI